MDSCKNNGSRITETSKKFKFIDNTEEITQGEFMKKMLVMIFIYKKIMDGWTISRNEWGGFDFSR
jgi:hypothetical protein